MDFIDVTKQLLFGILVSSLIGLNREAKSSHAGLKTYNLVCLGSVIITIIAREMNIDAINLIIAKPELSTVINVDTSKIIAQIVSGIGFLGAGTIIFNQKKISGLSTASSLWVTAAIGIAVGLNYYVLATISSILVVLILALMNKIVPIRGLKKISITFHTQIDEMLINKYFSERNIIIRKIETKVFSEGKVKYISNVFTIKPEKKIDMHYHIINLSKYEGVTAIELIDV